MLWVRHQSQQLSFSLLSPLSQNSAEPGLKGWLSSIPEMEWSHAAYLDLNDAACKVSHARYGISFHRDTWPSTWKMYDRVSKFITI